MTVFETSTDETYEDSFLPITLDDPLNAKMGLMQYESSVAPDQPVHFHYLVRLKETQGFVVSLADTVGP